MMMLVVLCSERKGRLSASGRVQRLYRVRWAKICSSTPGWYLRRSGKRPARVLEARRRAPPKGHYRFAHNPCQLKLQGCVSAPRPHPTRPDQIKQPAKQIRSRVLLSIAWRPWVLLTEQSRLKVHARLVLELLYTIVEEKDWKIAKDLKFVGSIDGVSQSCRKPECR